MGRVPCLRGAPSTLCSDLDERHAHDPRGGPELQHPIAPDEGQVMRRSRVDPGAAGPTDTRGVEGDGAARPIEVLETSTREPANGRHEACRTTGCRGPEGHDGGRPGVERETGRDAQSLPTAVA